MSTQPRRNLSFASAVYNNGTNTPKTQETATDHNNNHPTVIYYNYEQKMNATQSTSLQSLSENYDSPQKSFKRPIDRSPNESPETKQQKDNSCLLYTSPSPRDKRQSRMPSSA